MIFKLKLINILHLLLYSFEKKGSISKFHNGPSILRCFCSDLWCQLQFGAEDWGEAPPARKVVKVMHSQKWWVTFVPSLFCCYISDLFSSYFVVESTPHFKIRWQQDFLNPKLGCHICSVKVFPFQRWGMPRIEGHHAGYGRHAWDGWRGRRCVIRLIINDPCIHCKSCFLENQALNKHAGCCSQTTCKVSQVPASNRFF